MSVAVFACQTFSSSQQYSFQGSGMILIPNALSIWDPTVIYNIQFVLLCHLTKKVLDSWFFKLMANFQSSESLLRSLIGEGQWTAFATLLLFLFPSAYRQHVFLCVFVTYIKCRFSWMSAGRWWVFSEPWASPASRPVWAASGVAPQTAWCLHTRIQAGCKTQIRKHKYKCNYQL